MNSVEVYPAAILRMQAIAQNTPDTGEGSRGHLRSDAAWEIAEDWRRASLGDESVRDLFEVADGAKPTLSRIMAMCERDAHNAAERWIEQDRKGR